MSLRIIAYRDTVSSARITPCAGGAAESVFGPGPAPDAAAALQLRLRGRQGERGAVQPRPAHLPHAHGEGAAGQPDALLGEICEWGGGVSWVGVNVGPECEVTWMDEQVIFYEEAAADAFFVCFFSYASSLIEFSQHCLPFLLC